MNKILQSKRLNVSNRAKLQNWLMLFSSPWQHSLPSSKQKHALFTVAAIDRNWWRRYPHSTYDGCQSLFTNSRPPNIS